MARTLALGIDFGSDSVRALVADCRTGAELGAGVAAYPRWASGQYCDPAAQRFRQHPADHLESMRSAVRAALRQAGKGAAAQVVGIGVDTTGSSPLPIAAEGTALGLTPGFSEDPDALCILWKDHTAVAEAAELNALAASGRFPDYTRWVGGIYSSEWWWAKIAHVVRHNRRVSQAAHTWMEHCDWIPFVLTGAGDPARAARSRCAAGHKALWHAGWDGLPAEDFLIALEPRLRGLRARLYQETVTADQSAGGLCPEWAKAFGLRPGIAVAAGAFDAHLGAVGAGAKPNVLVKVMGTSTCDMLLAPPEAVGQRTVRGICGQVDGSILPGLIGLEAGQSAFGDIYAWYQRLLGWPLTRLPAAQRQRLLADMLPALEAAAAAVPPLATGELALDWFNGRRTPDADQTLRGAITGLHLGSDAPTLYRTLIEATAYGARAIVERFVAEGVAVDGVVALGGIARKSPLVMQICADVLNRPIAVVASDQCCALGAAMAGAAAAGVHASLTAAQRAMASPLERTYKPRRAVATVYDRGYQQYLALGQRPAAAPAKVLKHKKQQA
jgi:L-ribulokinase